MESKASALDSKITIYLGRSNMATVTTELDNPWKEVIEIYFKEFMLFFFPEIYARIDFSRGYDFLDKELQKVVRDAKMKRRLVDKLVKVRLKNGQTSLLYIHIEVQGQKDQDFAKRVFIYYYRLFDNYGDNVISLAILGDDQEDWRPNSYAYEFSGFEVFFRFPIIKLLDYQWKELEKSKNPFSIVVRTHLKALETRSNHQKRLYWKKKLFKALYEAKFSKKDILELFRFLDWVMALPKVLEQQFDQFTTQYEEEKRMPYVTSIERFGIEKGRKEGRQLGILQHSRKSVLDVLRTRFKRVPQPLTKMVQTFDDTKLLTKLLQEAALADSLESFKKRVEKLV